ncbi:SRS domain-containing protein [Neospora caninum Liverpool]|uniref:SRS domain-containing protein n=1 Tax=Neospora caninum (strain Liverpool) TaxID=572307 RepID=F0VES8_NEOCL|nr:SRS domain-containing protein [Neospora caninum Liverpool]CBZ52222.1 SRS domain-containing protein [Neospora caninum Liverpool]CEL66190.1 TPA: SRS domain-containing protein [Neospora caninum Liverpool]|eukprot:XP_003882254.1 SRS domain-containing protein [Neospora caninum Liverpool]
MVDCNEMAGDSQARCLGSHGLASTLQMYQYHGGQRKLRQSFRMGLTLMVLLAGTSLQYDNRSFLSVVRAVRAQAGTLTSKCEAAKDGNTTCTCLKDDSQTTTLSATLSEETNVLQVSCQTDLKCAPDDLSGKNVCPGDTDKLYDCKSTNGSFKCIDVNEILATSENSVQWVAGTTPQDSTTKTLAIPTDRFPFTDQKFVIGCVNDDRTADRCKVTVTLAARATAKKDQTVTCAYGASSNKEPQTITLSPSQNTFTLVCGTDGDILPSTYQKKYCSSSENNTTSACEEKDYTSIITTYQETWWQKKPEGTNVYTLEIPPNDFPTESANIVVGCKETATTTLKVEEDPSETDSSSVCKVVVTIEALANSSSATMSGVMASLALGGVAFIGALAHAL